jgi:hypothetical protein
VFRVFLGSLEGRSGRGETLPSKRSRVRIMSTSIALLFSLDAPDPTGRTLLEPGQITPQHVPNQPFAPIGYIPVLDGFLRIWNGYPDITVNPLLSKITSILGAPPNASLVVQFDSRYFAESE